VRHFVGLVTGTLALRLWVVVLFAGYLAGAVTKMGWVRTSLFATLALVVGLAAEAASTRSGFPLGAYRFVDATRAQELWLAGVPLWSPMLFCVLCWVGFQLAVLLYSPLELRRGDLQVLDTIAIRRSPRVLVTAAVLAATLAALLEPLKARGEQWFLGATHQYVDAGSYFDVPPAALVGWLLAAAVVIGVFQRLEPPLLRPTPLLRAGQAHLPYGGLVEPALGLALALLVLGVTVAIGERLLAVVTVLVVLPLALVFAAHILGAAAHATPAEREAHRRDFPRGRTLA
jgi:putative membrane protein